MDDAHRCGPLHLWGGQRLPLHILPVSVTFLDLPLLSSDSTGA